MRYIVASVRLNIFEGQVLVRVLLEHENLSLILPNHFLTMMVVIMVCFFWVMFVLLFANAA